MTYFDARDEQAVACNVREFWSPMVFSEMNTEPGIKYLLLALAMTHKKARHNLSLDDESFMVSCYGKALTALAKHGNTFIVLIASTMLAILEKFRGRPEWFLSHTAHGNQVLMEYDRFGSKSRDPEQKQKIDRYFRPANENWMRNGHLVVQYDLLNPRDTMSVTISKMQAAVHAAGSPHDAVEVEKSS